MFSMILFCSAISVSVTVPSHFGRVLRAASDGFPKFAAGAFRNGRERERVSGVKLCGDGEREEEEFIFHKRFA
jgi:hypothetical protein